MHDAKTHLSRYIADLDEGDRLLICRRNVPVAEVRPIKGKPREVAEPGRWEGRIEVPPEFFDPLPEDLLEAFSGTDEGG